MNRIINFITGLAGFVLFVYLARSNPESSIQIAIGVLLILVGFAGKETIIDILKSWKE